MKIAFPLLNEKELAIDFVHSHFIGKSRTLITLKSGHLN